MPPPVVLAPGRHPTRDLHGTEAGASARQSRPVARRDREHELLGEASEPLLHVGHGGERRAGKRGALHGPAARVVADVLGTAIPAIAARARFDQPAILRRQRKPQLGERQHRAAFEGREGTLGKGRVGAIQGRESMLSITTLLPIPGFASGSAARRC